MHTCHLDDVCALALSIKGHSSSNHLKVHRLLYIDVLLYTYIYPSIHLYKNNIYIYPSIHLYIMQVFKYTRQEQTSAHVDVRHTRMYVYMNKHTYIYISITISMYIYKLYVYITHRQARHSARQSRPLGHRQHRPALAWLTCQWFLSQTPCKLAAVVVTSERSE